VNLQVDERAIRQTLEKRSTELDLRVDSKAYRHRMSSYRISELARRSGFAPSTLRYYESVGLLPDPDRTEAGHRVYDDIALERLGFIARAKQMGLALDDIAELVALWTDGPCAPVQERLQVLLEEKVADVRHQLSDLNGFAAQLDHLRSSLASIEPGDRCGPGCGCDTELSDPIVCTLPTDARDDRLAAWTDVVGQVVEREATPSGMRLRFNADPKVVSTIADLAVREAECCAFFSFTITVDGRGVWLAVDAPPDGRLVLEALFG
jgi:DNA-binding transcriptional MerR regulator